MHGWNRLSEQGFYKDLKGALPFLKKGGKYILGPINQRLYFSGYNSEFNAKALTIALQTLKEDGLIEYEFRKGDKNGNGGEDGFFEERNWDPNIEVLHDNESACSLIITKK